MWQNTVTYDVSTAQCENGTIKCEKKKINEPLNVTKVQSYVMLMLCNVRKVHSNVRKNKGTIECDKNTITCDVNNT